MSLRFGRMAFCFHWVVCLAWIFVSGCHRSQMPVSFQTPVRVTEQEGAGSAASSASRPLSGQELFMAHCVRCHRGPQSPPGPDATITGSERLASEDSFRQLLRHPTSFMMKTFSEQELDNAKVHALYAYLRTQR